MKGLSSNPSVNTNILFQNDQLGLQEKEIIINDVFEVIDDLDKQQMAADLLLAQDEIASENLEKGKRAAEFEHSQDELALQSEQTEAMANKLFIAQNELAHAETIIQAHQEGLEEIMFVTSHKVRQPIANILGIAGILDHFLSAPATIKKMVGYIKDSTLSLDTFTKELTALITNLKRRKLR